MHRKIKKNKKLLVLFSLFFFFLLSTKIGEYIKLLLERLQILVS